MQTSRQDSQKKLLLIDAMSLAFRAYYSMPESMTAPDGSSIGAVYGFVSMIMQALDKVHPSHVAVCFDMKGPTFRHHLYDDYKGHRPAPPESFIAQIPLFRSILDAMGIKRVEQAGFEADDIIGTLSEIADQVQMKSIIVTGDSDSLQLVSDHTSVMITRKGISDIVMHTPESVQEYYGITSHQLIDFKALKGDTSDNIPGVKGIGEKTAITLIKTYHTLEGIYQNIDQVTPNGLRQKLIDGKAMAELSKILVTIKLDVPIEPKLEDFEFKPNWQDILNTFKKYAFNSLIRKYQNYLQVQQNATNGVLGDSPYHGITSLNELSEILSKLTSRFAIDLETTSLSIMDAQIVGVALSWKHAQGVYIPLNDYVIPQDTQQSLFDTSVIKDPLYSTRFRLNPYLEQLKPFLENANIPKTTHNGKYEWAVLANYGIQFAGIQFDTMIAAYLLFPGERLGLKELTSQLLGCEMTTYEQVAGTGKSQLRFDQVSIDHAIQYAAADADMTWRLTQLLAPMLKEKGLESLFNDIELPTMLVLGKMERAGVKLNIPYLKQLETEFAQKQIILESQIYQEAGSRFNINSTQQLGDILYDKLNLPVLKKTKTGRSTDASVLEKLIAHHPIAKLMLDYRTLEKLQNTYIKALPQLVNPITNKIHAHFNQTIAATGRLSSTTPNLQNIPIRTEEGSKIRHAFIPSMPNGQLLSADYSQIELRILAHLSQDPNMLMAFKKGEDIHQATASLIFEVPLDQVNKEQRYQAKTVNFGIIYGQSAFGLSETLGIGRKEAAEIIAAYYLRFPDIKAFMDKTIQFARDKGFVMTEFGRKRPVPDIHSKNPGLRQFSERMAVNTRMQGTAADLIKIAMINIQTDIEKKALKSRMIIQVHDELVFDVSHGEEDTLKNIVVTRMESATQFSIPLKVDATFGDNWQSL